MGSQKQPSELAAAARSYLDALCGVQPNRRTGSPGNLAATHLFAELVRAHGYRVDDEPFEALDYVCEGVELTESVTAYEVCVSPYAPACDVVAGIVAVSTLEELRGVDCEGRILLMRGELCSEPLMPKNFVFYNPDHHREILAVLEARKPAAIVAATGKNPDLAGALDPFPLIADGDFDIPSVCCRRDVGDALAVRRDRVFRLRIRARRLPSRASNVIARLHPEAERRVVLTAHVDAYGDSPGASDNASGVVVLLLCARMLSGYAGPLGVELAALNGEDHYSAGGQMDYLRRHADAFPGVLLAVNVDGVGGKGGRSAFSFYDCPPGIEEAAGNVFRRFPGVVRGDPWFSGDHMIFVQGGVPCLAFTSEHAQELMRTVHHTSSDTPDIVDCERLVELASALDGLVRAL